MSKVEGSVAETTPLPAWWYLPPRVAALCMSDEERALLLEVLTEQVAAQD